MRLGHLGVVCAALASMARMGHYDAIAAVALELARQGSPDAAAKVPPPLEPLAPSRYMSGLRQHSGCPPLLHALLIQAHSLPSFLTPALLSHLLERHYTPSDYDTRVIMIYECTATIHASRDLCLQSGGMSVKIAGTFGAVQMRAELVGMDQQGDARECTASLARLGRAWALAELRLQLARQCQLAVRACTAHAMQIFVFDFKRICMHASCNSQPRLVHGRTGL
jgi:hypothetical protein